MSLTKFRRKTRPFTNLVTSDFFDMEDFFDNIWKRGMFSDRFWNGRSGEPALNIKETEDHYEIELAAPGFDKEDFEITIDSGYLNISAKKSEEQEEKEEEFTRREFSYKEFERSLLLPENVAEEELQAKYKTAYCASTLLKKKWRKNKNPKR